MNQQAPPPAHEVKRNILEKRENLAKAFKNFHVLISSQTLDKNKTKEAKLAEDAATKNLMIAAGELDIANIGEGIMAVASVALREHLQMRDRMNEMEYRLLLALKKLQDRIDEMSKDGEK